MVQHELIDRMDESILDKRYSLEHLVPIPGGVGKWLDHFVYGETNRDVRFIIDDAGRFADVEIVFENGGPRIWYDGRRCAFRGEWGTNTTGWNVSAGLHEAIWDYFEARWNELRGFI